MAILAIDQGTTSTRALRVGKQGQTELTKVIKHQQYYPNPGWVEHDPEELISNIKLCIEASLDADESRNTIDPITAIGIDNQGESCLAWHGDTKQAISPVIVWQDSRTEAVIEKLKHDKHENRVLALSGLPLDAYFSASKLAWIIDNHPEAKTLLKQGKLRLGTTDAFFLDRLTDCFVTDITTASRTSLLNLQSGDWDHELCELFNVPIEALPKIVSTTGELGGIVSQGKNIPVTASVVDQQASLYGHGCRKSGDCKITFGTGAFALMVTGSELTRSPEQGLLPTIAWQLQDSKPVYALDGGVYCAGSAINWAQNLGLFENYSDINQFNKPAAIERDIVFVPALAGLACPHWDRRAAGIWIGMSLDTDQQDLAQSVLEGVALRASEVIQAMGDFHKIGEKLSIDGGVSGNPYFCQFLANALQKQVSVKSMAELTAIGTAQLAGTDEITLSENEDQHRHYFPEKAGAEYLQRFQHAVNRSREWRQA